MKRRTLVVMLPALATANLASIVDLWGSDCIPQDLLCDWPEPVFVYRGMPVSWTGWKGASTSRHICGQWTALERLPNGRVGRCFYVNTPGTGEGPYRPGDEFYIGGWTLEDEEGMFKKKYRLQLIEQGRQRMIALLDQYL